VQVLGRGTWEGGRLRGGHALRARVKNFALPTDGDDKKYTTANGPPGVKGVGRVKEKKNPKKGRLLCTTKWGNREKQE